MLQLSNYLAGRNHPPTEGRFLENFEPATGKVYSQVPDSTPADLDLAVAAAEKALPGWSALPLEKRFRILNGIAEGIERRLELLAQAETKDNGKPITLSRTLDIPRAAANFRFFATALMQFSSESHATGMEAINYTLREPIGIVGCISPWNLPLYLFTWKIAPALAAGNCVIAKPSELTPMTACLLGEICTEAGLPPGVLAILHGRGAGIGAAIVNHPKLKAISFTGGTVTGATIAAAAAPKFKKLSLELGGKNPTLVFADCEFTATLDGTVRAAFANQGEICLCGSRIFVERSLYPQFREAFIARVAALKLGDPQLEETQQGALISAAHLAKVAGYVDQARRTGGTILTGGKVIAPPGRCAGGYFYLPTVVEGLPADCSFNQEEIFGPVASLLPFDTEEEAIAMANGVRYGLAASVWSRDVKRCHRLGRQLEAGVVWINCWLLRDLRTPFGGMKDSGIGREGGWEALRFFTEARNVCLKL